MQGQIARVEVELGLETQTTASIPHNFHATLPQKLLWPLGHHLGRKQMGQSAVGVKAGVDKLPESLAAYQQCDQASPLISLGLWSPRGT